MSEKNHLFRRSPDKRDNVYEKWEIFNCAKRIQISILKVDIIYFLTAKKITDMMVNMHITRNFRHYFFFLVLMITSIIINMFNNLNIYKKYCYACNYLFSHINRNTQKFFNKNIINYFSGNTKLVTNFLTNNK